MCLKIAFKAEDAAAADGIDRTQQKQPIYTLKATEQLSLKCVDSEHLWDWGRLKPEFSAACARQSVMSPLFLVLVGGVQWCHSRLIKGTSLPNIAAAAYRRRKALFGISFLFLFLLLFMLLPPSMRQVCLAGCWLCTLCVCALDIGITCCC